MRAAVVVFDGVDELDAIGPYEVLATAAELGGDLQVELVTIEPQETVRAANGLVFQPHRTMPERVDILIVPGGGWSNRAPQGAYAEAERGNLPRAIAALHGAGTTVASVCTGGMLVAASGLLGGRPAITHHAAIQDLRESGAQVVEARVVDDGDVVTSGGITSGLDLALWLVERYLGADLAARVADELEHERRGEVARKA
jgi:transcriptional regulator GlxA family with amidase domain